MSDIIKLRNVNIDVFKKYITKTTKLTNSVLSCKLELNENVNTLSSMSNNLAESVFKKWSVDLESFCEVESSSYRGDVKMVIADGANFIKNTLGYFGDVCSLDITCINGEAVSVKIYNDVLEMLLTCTPINMAYIEYEDESVIELFSNTGASEFFVISEEELKQIIKLCAMKGGDKSIQKNHVKFYTKDGVLRATDDIFDWKIHEQDNEITYDASISKDLISLFDLETHKFELYPKNNEDICIQATSDNSDTITSVLSNNDLDSDSQMIEDVEVEFSWDD